MATPQSSDPRDPALLDSLAGVCSAWLDAVESCHDAAIGLTRDALDRHGRAMLDALQGTPPDPGVREAMVKRYTSTLHTLSSRHAEWLERLQDHLALCEGRLHARFADAEQWVPKGTELSLRIADIVTGAFEQSLEGLAEATADAARGLESPSDEADPETSSPTAARRAARRKAA